MKRIPVELVPFLIWGNYSRSGRIMLLSCAPVSTPRTPPTQDAHPRHRPESQPHRSTHEEGNCCSLDLQLIIYCT